MYARYRSRNDFNPHFHFSDVFTSGHGETHHTDGAYNDPFGELETVPRDFSVISDVVGSPGTYNPVYHYSFKGLFADPAESYDWGEGWAEHDIPPVVAHRPIAGDSIPRSLEPSQPSAATLSEWSVEAFNMFHDQIPTQVQLANFLYELRDIQGLIPKITKHSPIKTVSSNFLGLEFGWKPMIGDIKKILDLASTVDKRLKYLKETAGKTVTLKFERDMNLSQDPYSLVRSRDGSPRNFKYKRVSQKGTFLLTGKLKQNLEDLDGIGAHLKAFAAATGFNNPAAIVWEAIPYSFVVDWLFHLQGIIGTMAIQPFGGEWTISDVGYSVKQSATYLVYQSFLWPASSNVDVLLGTLDIKSYARKPGFPVVSLFITDGSLTPKQLALSLALLDQRR